MEDRIHNRVIIAVNKRNKLLGYLRKLNSGDIEGVSVRIIHALREKPINLFFTRSGTVDDFLVYAEYGITGVAILEICKKLNLPLIVNFHGFSNLLFGEI